MRAKSDVFSRLQKCKEVLAVINSVEKSITSKMNMKVQLSPKQLLPLCLLMKFCPELTNLSISLTM